MTFNWQQYLKDNGLQITQERVAIYEVVSKMKGHFSPEAVQEVLISTRNMRISRTTAFNTFNILVQAQILVKHTFAMGEYERKQEAKDHYHIICLHCNKIKEVKYSKIRKKADRNPTALQELIGDLRYPSFKTDYHALYMYGMCNACIRRVNTISRVSRKRTNDNKKQDIT